MRTVPFLLAGLLVVGGGVSGCSSNSMLNSITPDDDFRLATDIAYDTNGDKLDVYTPPHAQNAAVVVFIAGGRWEQASTLPKEKYRFVGEALSAKGFIAMVPNYRTYPQVKFPDFVEDCAKAVVWAHANAKYYGGDPNKIVVLGHSAGAYNAAMLALNADYMKRAGGDRAWLRGMIGLAGAYDFLPLTDPDLRDLFGPPENFETTQPILFADGSNPPMLLMAGEDDNIVNVSNTNNLYDRIKRNNGTVEKVIYPKMSTHKIISSLATRLQSQSDVMKYVVSFVQRTTAAPPKQNNYGIQTSIPK
ncbi:MAG: alpha/beta hydrolase [Nevskia sp.]|nr:alpha/beta hydrolase [Nevskia sp.]